MQQHFFIEGCYLGKAVRKPLPSAYGNSVQQAISSYLISCQGCGKEIAKCPVELQNGLTTSWRSGIAICATCPRPPHFPNLIRRSTLHILSPDSRYLPSTLHELPDQYIIHEALLHLEHFASIESQHHEQS